MSAQDPEKKKLLGGGDHVAIVYDDERLGGPIPHVSVDSMSKKKSDSALQSPSSNDELWYRHALISFLIGEQQLQGTLAHASTWYLDWLERKCEEQWYLLQSALAKVNQIDKKPSSEELREFYKIVIQILRLLRSKKDLALVEIVDDLDNEGLLRTHLDENDNRAAPNQVVFSILGWLTMLYAPAIRPAKDKLEIRQNCAHTPQDHALSGPIDNCTIQQEFEYIDRPLSDTLANLGLLPLGITAQNGWPERWAESKSEMIMSGIMRYQALQEAGLEIIWVDSMSYHLDLDLKLGKLKLFRYPSFCRLMYSGKEDSILSQLFNYHGDSIERGLVSDVSLREYCREIILSYRLFFGRQEKSWQAGFKLVENLRTSTQTDQDFDPLLSVICATSLRGTKARQIYHDMDITEAGDYYDTNSDFPILSRRLLKIQQYVQAHQSQNVFSLRDASGRAAAWSSLWNNKKVLALLALVTSLLIISLFFQIWQIVLTRQQVELAQHGGFSNF